MPQATLEQRRAAFALAKVGEVKGRADKAKYKTQLLKLPARLHTNGLGQTVAFYLAEGSGSPEAEICGWLGTWLGEQEIYDRQQRLIDSIVGTGRDDAAASYRRASAEARALAVWLKRFAEAFIEGQAT